MEISVMPYYFFKKLAKELSHSIGGLIVLMKFISTKFLSAGFNLIAIIKSDFRTSYLIPQMSSFHH